MPTVLVNVLLLLVAVATARGADIGILPRKLVVEDALARKSRAKTTFVARDAAVTAGPATHLEDVRVRLHVEYADGLAAGAFVIPAGSAEGWTATSTSGTRYRNRTAPAGPTQVRTFVLRSGRLLKLRAAGLGDTPLDIEAPPSSAGVYVRLEIVDGGTVTRLCSVLEDCTHRALAGGTGARLVCRRGAADPTCRAAHPLYTQGEQVRYGGRDTVAVIGDSITVSARVPLERALEHAWFVHVSAVSGQMFREAQRAADRVAASAPAAVVIDLGTNDQVCWLLEAFHPSGRSCRYPGFGPDDVRADARAMVAGFAPGTCILGTTGWFTESSNELWLEMAAAGEIAGVVPWRAFLDSLTAAERELLVVDFAGHLTEAGTVALAELTRQTVDDVCGGA